MTLQCFLVKNVASMWGGREGWAPKRQFTEDPGILPTQMPGGLLTLKTRLLLSVMSPSPPALPSSGVLLEQNSEPSNGSLQPSPTAAERCPQNKGTFLKHQQRPEHSGMRSNSSRCLRWYVRVIYNFEGACTYPHLSHRPSASPLSLEDLWLHRQFSNHHVFKMAS